MEPVDYAKLGYQLYHCVCGEVGRTKLQELLCPRCFRSIIMPEPIYDQVRVYNTIQLTDTIQV